MGKYWISLTHSSKLLDMEFASLKRKAYGFFVLRGFLYKKGKSGYPPQRVVGLKDERLEVLKGCHEEVEHRGCDGTIDRLKERYYWDRMILMHFDILNYVRNVSDKQRFNMKSLCIQHGRYIVLKQLESTVYICRIQQDFAILFLLEMTLLVGLNDSLYERSQWKRQ